MVAAGFQTNFITTALRPSQFHGLLIAPRIAPFAGSGVAKINLNFSLFETFDLSNPALTFEKTFAKRLESRSGGLFQLSSSGPFPDPDPLGSSRIRLQNGRSYLIRKRVGRALERQGLLARDLENSFLTLDSPDVSNFDVLLGYSITYRITLGAHQGRKAFTLQTVPAAATLDGNKSLAKAAGLLRASCHAPCGPACGCSKTLPAILSRYTRGGERGPRTREARANALHT